MYSQPEIFFIPLGFGGAFLITLLFKEKILVMIKKAGFVRPNFKGEQVPLAAGVVFPMSVAAAALPLFFLGTPELLAHVVLFLLAVTGAAFLGLLDDFWGSRDASGLKGHLKALLQGHLTTGAVKALGGGCFALILALQLYLGDLWRIIDSVLIIALSINLINLFDLRPGRAGKAYLLIALILFPMIIGTPEGVLTAITLGTLLAFLPVDLKARAMMGDVGSNALGMALGLTAAAALEEPTRFIYLGILIIIHIITEKYSLTRIIAGNSFLNYLDMLGREK